LDFCFAEKDQINVEEFKEIAREKTSDLVLPVFNLLRQMPCSYTFY